VITLQYLFFSGCQHGNDGETDGLDREGGAPVVGENGEADVTVAVHVRVDGDLLAHEDHLRRVEGILGAKFKLKQNEKTF
jgi:hypothetical protein